MNTRRLRDLCGFCLGLLACALAMPAAAQLSSLHIPPGVLRPPMLVTPVDPQDAAPTPVVTAANMSSGPLWLRSSFDMDLPRDTGTGIYTKPKIMVGLPSPQMRGWLRASGLEAEKCMLPMLRARTSMAGGDLNGSFWLYARCTFH